MSISLWFVVYLIFSLYDVAQLHHTETNMKEYIKNDTEEMAAI